MKNGGKGKSGLLIFLLVAALVLAGGSGLIALMRSGYRTIQLYQLDREAAVLQPLIKRSNSTSSTARRSCGAPPPP